MPAYDLAVVREMLVAAFGIEEINTLAFDLFPHLHADFAASLSKSARVLRIVSAAEKANRLPALAEYVKENSRHQYDRFAPRLFKSADAPSSVAELEGQIAREQTVLLQYEQMEHLEDDPRRRLRLQENIEEAKRNILTLEMRVVQLRAENSPARAVVRRESVFIANVPYGLETALHGREQELALLDDWFQRDDGHPLLAVIGLGGQGKSALVWLWQKQLQANRLAPPLVVWWSFYERDGTMRALLAELLAHFGEDPGGLNLRQAVEHLRRYLQRTPVLLVLDGAERLLRAYQGDSDRVAEQESWAREEMRRCVDPAAGVLLQWLAETGVTQTKTLLTSRLFPQELAGRSGLGLVGVRRYDLTGLNGAAALALFRELGIGATRAEVEAVCAPLGYHPLSLRLLARAIRYSPTAPNDVQAAADYDPTSDLLGKREHVLRRAYDNLPPTAQKLLSQLAAFRGGVGWRVLADVFGGGGRVLQRDLQLLEERGLPAADGAAVGGWRSRYPL